MTCAETWIKVRRGCAAPTSLSRQNTPASSGKTKSRRLEVYAGAVDDLDDFHTPTSPQRSTALAGVAFPPVELQSFFRAFSRRPDFAITQAGGRGIVHTCQSMTQARGGRGRLTHPFADLLGCPLPPTR